MADPVIIEYQKDGPLKGAQYQVESAEVAARVHPDAVVVSYFDGRPLEGAVPSPVTPGAPEAPPVAAEAG